MDKIVAHFGYILDFPFCDSDKRLHLWVVVNAVSDHVTPNGEIIPSVGGAHDLVRRRSINIQKARNSSDYDIVC
jgi:hypothetical protein